MKAIKIGKSEYRQCETIFDINAGRHNVFKQYLLQTFEKIDEPLFHGAYSRYISHFNAGDHAQGLLEWHNLKLALSEKGKDWDAFDMCFALITLEKDEDQLDTSEATQISKINKMRKAGLTRGQVEADVENFMKASPKTFGVYLGMLDLMREPLPEEILKK